MFSGFQLLFHLLQQYSYYVDTPKVLHLLHNEFRLSRNRTVDFVWYNFFIHSNDSSDTLLLLQLHRELLK